MDISLNETHEFIFEVCYDRVIAVWERAGSGIMGRKNRDIAYWEKDYVDAWTAPEHWSTHVLLMPDHLSAPAHGVAWER